MAGNDLGTQTITQIGIVVHDIEAVARKYADFFGIDKPDIIVTDAVDKAQTEYNGERTEARAKLAFFHLGSLDLELIEPDEHPSTWREHLNRHGEGVHHIALQIKGMKEKIQLLGQTGYPLQQKGEYTGGRYAYMDTSNDLKVLIELLEQD